MQRRTEITIETEHLLVLSRRGKRNVFWCNRCARNVEMLTVEQAASTPGMEEAEQLHFAITPEGRLLICSNSLDLESARREVSQHQP